MGGFLDVGALQTSGAGLDLGPLQSGVAGPISIDGSNTDALESVATAFPGGILQGPVLKGPLDIGALQATGAGLDIGPLQSGAPPGPPELDASNQNVLHATATPLHVGAVLNTPALVLSVAGGNTNVLGARATPLSTGALLHTPGLISVARGRGFWPWFPGQGVFQMIDDFVKGGDDGEGKQ